MSAIRVALIRGSALNPFDAQQYERLGPGIDVTAFGARPPRYEVDRIGLPVRSLADIGSRVPGRLHHQLQRRGPVWMSPETLVGLTAATRGFDILHVAETHLGFSAQAALIRRRRSRARLVVTVWENIPFLYEDGGKQSRRKALVRSVADSFVAVTEQARDALVLEGVPPDRITVRAPAVSDESFSPSRRRLDAFARFGVPPGADVVLYVGRLIREKGVLDLVLAHARLPGQVHLVLVGSGDERPRLDVAAHRAGTADRVHFVESVGYREVGALMASAQVLCVPSLPTPYWLEQFGMVLAEAMHSGVPIVAADSGAIGEVVGDAGVLVPPYDPGGLADGLERVLSQSGLAESLIARGARRAAERYATEPAGHWWAAHYRSVMAG